MEDLKREMIEELAHWVIGIAQKEMASAEEIAALADVARIVAGYSFGLSGEIK